MSTLRATLKESRTQPQTHLVRLKIKIRADRTSAAHDTWTHSALEDSCTPHSDTTPRYTRTLLPDTHCEDPRTLHSDTQAPLHPDTTLGYTRAPDSCVCPVRQHSTTSRSVFQTRVHWRTNTPLTHDPCSGSMLSTSCCFNCSSSSSRTTIHTQKFEYYFSKISLDPFRFCSKLSESLKLTPFCS